MENGGNHWFYKHASAAFGFKEVTKREENSVEGDSSTSDEEELE